MRVIPVKRDVTLLPTAQCDHCCKTNEWSMESLLQTVQTESIEAKFSGGALLANFDLN